VNTQNVFNFLGDIRQYCISEWKIILHGLSQALNKKWEYIKLNAYSDPWFIEFHLSNETKTLHTAL